METETKGERRSPLGVKRREVPERRDFFPFVRLSRPPAHYKPDVALLVTGFPRQLNHVVLDPLRVQPCAGEFHLRAIGKKRGGGGGGGECLYTA